MRVIFFGTPSFAAEVLRYLVEHAVDVVAVVSKPDRPQGRSGHPVATPVKQVAQELLPHVPLYQPEKVSAPEWIEPLAALQADLFVVVAYGEILKQHLLEMPKRACINLHASLLPKYRGAAPIQRALFAGEKETGATIMHMVKQMDAGDMIRRVKVAIGADTTYGELEALLCEKGRECLLQVIREFENGEPPRTPQDHSQATLAPKIELEDCQIDWRQPAEVIHHLVRGSNPTPGAWCWVTVKGERKRLKVLRTVIATESTVQGDAAGQVVPNNDRRLLVATGAGTLELLEVQLEGKKAMKTEELLRGLSKDKLSFLADPSHSKGGG